MDPSTDERHGLSPETLKILSPEYQREQEEADRRDDEIEERAIRHLEEARRILDSLKR